ncbi:MAG: hypothetical protein ACJAU0_001649 [Flavobacteriales bacterium]|jgi:hypothetical protein
MKILHALTVMLIFSVIALSTKAQNDQLPSFDQLPKNIGEQKTFFELDNMAIYQLYTSDGLLIQDSIAKFVETTFLPAGEYFFEFDGKRVAYSVVALPNQTDQGRMEFEKLLNSGEPEMSSFELEGNAAYQLYDGNGTLLQDSIAKIIDTSHLPKGIYFFSYDGKRVMYTK